VDQIINAVCDAAGVKKGVLFSRGAAGVPSRRAEIVDARNAAAHLLRHRRGLVSQELEFEFGFGI
jgi:hypothetical protein